MFIKVLLTVIVVAIVAVVVSAVVYTMITINRLFKNNKIRRRYR